MKQIIFTIYDTKAESFNTPFFQNTIGQATRSFTDAVNDPTTSMHNHPEDFTLFEIGSIDLDTAKMETLDTPVSHGLAIHYKTDVPTHPIAING